MRDALLAGLSALFLAAPALAQEIRPQEQARLDRFERLAGTALLEAMAEGSEGDITALVSALGGVPQVAFDPSLQGEWTCRTIKLGGAGRLVVYSNFKCNMSLDNTGITFEKLTGSQLTSGRIEMREGRAVYLGVGYVASETPQNYGDLDPAFEGSATVMPDVAVFERVSDTRARLMFPRP